MLHYWPRISMSLTLDDVDPLQYVEDTESKGLPTTCGSDGAIISLDTMKFCLESIGDNCFGVSFLLVQLLRRHSSVFSVLESIFSLQSPISPSLSSGRVSVREFDVRQLLTINLAARCARGMSPTSEMTMIEDVQHVAFTSAFSQIGDLILMPEDESVPFLLLASFSLMAEAYPVGALKLIQIAGDRLGRCSRR